MNLNFNEAKADAKGVIESIKFLVQNVKKGQYTGRLYSKLIDADPINSALESINIYKNLAQDYNEIIDETLVLEMIKAENELADFLIAKEKQRDPEAIAIIQQIIEIKNYGLHIFQRVRDSHDSNHLEKEFSITKVSLIWDLPEEAIIEICAYSDAKGLSKLMTVSKDFFKYANNLNLWKALCLNVNPSLLEEYPGLNKVPNKQIAWKKIYEDETFIDVKQWSGDSSLGIKNFNTNITKYLSLDLFSDNLNAKILKKIVKKTFELDCELKEIHLLLCAQIIPNMTILKKLSNSKYSTIDDLIRDGKPIIFVIRKMNNASRNSLIPHEENTTIPLNWINQDSEPMDIILIREEKENEKDETAGKTETLDNEPVKSPFSREKKIVEEEKNLSKCIIM